jgi:hypothetical protein
MDQIEPRDGDFFEGVQLETFRDYQVSRPRVRPVELLPQWLKVEFPRDLREANPIGTVFRADVYVRQKHYPNGAPKGPLYLRAENSTITKLAEPTTNEVQVARQQRGTISGRAYEYIVIRSAYDAFQKKLFRLRVVAYSSAKEPQMPLLFAEKGANWLLTMHGCDQKDFARRVRDQLLLFAEMTNLT